jgi:HupE / UreJ protein
VRRLPRALLVAAGLVLSPPLGAHPLNVGIADIAISERQIEVQLSLNLFELDVLLSLDRDLDARVDLAEVEARRPELVGYLTSKVGVLVGAESAPAEVGAFHVRQSADGKPTFETTLRFTSREPLQAFTLRCEPLTELGADHKTIARIVRGGRSEQFVFQQGVVYEAKERTFAESAAQFLELGIHHIFVGYDHLAFLIALVLPRQPWLELVKIVTSFTVAHSVTLSLAALDIVRLPATLVEVGIALSVAWVAMENLRAKTFNRRWVVSFLFGFVHGFGFANVLQELHLGRSALVASLIFFNVGVEIGQVVIISLLLPLLWLLARTPAHAASVKVASLAILVAGTFWFFERLL